MEHFEILSGSFHSHRLGAVLLAQLGTYPVPGAQPEYLDQATDVPRYLRFCPGTEYCRPRRLRVLEAVEFLLS